MTHSDRIKNIHGIAMALAPSLQRYDFSSPEHGKMWAEQTYASAEAFWTHIEPKFSAALEKDCNEVKSIQAKAKQDASDAAKVQLAKDAETNLAVKQVIEESKQGEPS